MLKIALLQIAPGDTLEENLKKGVEYCRRAAALGAEGATVLSGLSHIDRGYESLESMLQSLGAEVEDFFVLDVDLPHGHTAEGAGVPGLSAPLREEGRPVQLHPEAPPVLPAVQYPGGKLG